VIEWAVQRLSLSAPATPQAERRAAARAAVRAAERRVPALHGDGPPRPAAAERKAVGCWPEQLFSPLLRCAPRQHAHANTEKR
jgi:hypothetical protein